MIENTRLVRDAELIDCGKSARTCLAMALQLEKSSESVGGGGGGGGGVRRVVVVMVLSLKLLLLEVRTVLDDFELEESSSASALARTAA